MSTSIEGARQSIGLSHQLLGLVIDGLSADAACHTFPDTRMNSIAATMAHAVYGEDFMINNQLLGRETMLTRDGWLARTGIPDANQTLSPAWVAAEYDWDGLKEYVAALFAETEGLLAKLTPAELAHAVPTPFGTEAPATDYLAMFPVVHLSSHVGEIAALKGAQGLTGYPF